MRTFEAYSVTRILRHHLHAVLRRLVRTTAAHFPRRTLAAVLGTRYSNILAREHFHFIYCAHAILVTSSPPTYHVVRSVNAANAVSAWHSRGFQNLNNVKIVLLDRVDGYVFWR